MAAWLGLTPRQMTTGGKSRLLGISKRANRYLRKNLIHGARAVLPYLVERKTRLGRWARGLLARAPKNIPVVVLAISWRASPGRCWRAAALMRPQQRHEERDSRRTLINDAAGSPKSACGERSWSHDDVVRT